MCYRCFKPRVTCLCGSISRVHNRTGIHIVQHVRERAHPIGTARIAMLGLEKARMETVCASNGRFESGGTFPPRTALLYPTQDALPMETLPDGSRPEHLVVIDGTWHQASRIYRDSPALQALPCLTFGTERPSNYRIRREPTRAANATIEAICRALEILEPDTPGISGLLSIFDRMIDDQVRRAEQKNGRRVLRPRQRTSKCLPRLIRDNTSRLLLACGESGPRHLPPRQRGLLTWSAVRLADGEGFNQVLRPIAPLADREIAHMGLDERVLAGGLSVSAFRRAWRGFVRPDDVLITWNKQPMGRLFALVGPHPRFLFLKAVYGNIHRGKCGTLDEVVAREGLAPGPMSPADVSLTPRAIQRLAQIASVLSFLLGARDDFSPLPAQKD